MNQEWNNLGTNYVRLLGKANWKNVRKINLASAVEMVKLVKEDLNYVKIMACDD